MLSFLSGEAALALVSLFERLISWSYSLRPLASDPILEFASRPQFSCKLCMLLAVLSSLVTKLGMLLALCFLSFVVVAVT